MYIKNKTKGGNVGWKSKKGGVASVKRNCKKSLRGGVRCKSKDKNYC